MHRYLLPGVVCLILISSHNVAADQLTLKNGDRVSGSIIKSDGKTIVFKGELVGEVNIALDNVTEILTDKPLYVGLADGRTVVGTVKSTGGQTEIRSGTNVVTVSQGTIQFVRSEEEQRIYEKTLNPGWMEQWTGGANLGIALTKGNSDTTNVALGLDISRATLRDKTSLYGAGVYNRDSTDGESRTIANTLRFGGRYDRDFNKKWFAYFFSDL